MEFKKYKRERKISNQPIISLDKKGFRLNKACAATIFKEIDFVELFYEEKQKIIAIKPVKEETENSYTVRKYRDSNVGLISASDFIGHFRLTKLLPIHGPEGTRQWMGSIKMKPEWDETKKMYLLKIK